MDAQWLLERYQREHNRLVRGEAPNPGSLLSLFAPDAEMVFEGVDVGPFEGSAAIGRAFKDRPPTDELTLSPARPVDETTIVADYRWASAPTRRAGTITLVEKSGYIARLTVWARRST